MFKTDVSHTEKQFEAIDLKEVSDTGVFEGYASKFGHRDQGGDVVEKGAFKASLAQRKASGVKMLWQHHPSEPIGFWEDIKEDNIGLKVTGRLLLSVTKARETYELMKAGVIDGLSIGYRTIKALRDDSTGFRQLKEVDLWEISLVTFPMLTSATITSVKGDWTKREVERVLREAGMPNAMAVKLIASGFDAANTLGQRDADDGINNLAERLRQMNENLKRSLS